VTHAALGQNNDREDKPTRTLSSIALTGRSYGLVGAAAEAAALLLDLLATWEAAYVPQEIISLAAYRAADRSHALPGLALVLL
jgi:hypothetical protein